MVFAASLDALEPLTLLTLFLTDTNQQISCRATFSRQPRQEVSPELAPAMIGKLGTCSRGKRQRGILRRADSPRRVYAAARATGVASVELMTFDVRTLGVPSITAARLFNTSAYPLEW